MSSPSIREWLVERVRLGEASPSIQLTPAERERLEELEAEDRAILFQYPPGRVAAEIRRRGGDAQPSAQPGLARVGTWGAAAAMAGLVVFALSGGEVGYVPDDPSGLEPTRSKGGDALVAHRASREGVELVQPNDALGAGERIQISYRLEAPAYAVMLSVDGRGLVSLHLPAKKGQPPPRVQVGRGVLPYSYELDDAPMFERFFLITGPDRFRTQDVVAAAEALAQNAPDRVREAPLELPNGLTQTDLVLLKDEER